MVVRSDQQESKSFVPTFIIVLVIGLVTAAGSGAPRAEGASLLATAHQESRDAGLQIALTIEPSTPLGEPNADTEQQRLLERTHPWLRVKRLGRQVFHDSFERMLKNMFFAWPFWAALVGTLVLERLNPAQPNRKIFSVNFGQDLIWFLYEPVLHAAVVATYVAVLEKTYEVGFSWLTLSGLSATPGWLRFTVALLLIDFCYWVQHVVNHKIPFLWQLHAVHHSQQQLNFFTDFRYHPLEYVIRETFLVVPFLFLKIDPPVIVAVAVVKEWYSRFYHGNIRTNLGPLKYVLVTPQSHRVHHSLEARHRDKNFGAIFSVWDFLFRQQYLGFDEYPETGIDDDRFPNERQIGLMTLLWTPWQQMLHPLKKARVSPAAPEARVN